MTQIVGNLATDPNFGVWRERAAKFNLHSSVAIPFAPAGQEAILCIYARSEYTFDKAVIKDLEAIAREVEFAIAQVRTKHKLEEALNGTLLSLWVF